MSRKTTRGVVAVLASCVMVAGCGGASSSPTPVGKTPSVSSGPSVNLAPVIEAVTLSSDRVEVDNDITLTANVTDAETPTDQLKYEWKAPAGSFTGEGATVRWRAPKDIKTPADYTITLTVTEVYGTPNAVWCAPPECRERDRTARPRSQFQQGAG